MYGERRMPGWHSQLNGHDGFLSLQHEARREGKWRGWDCWFIAGTERHERPPGITDAGKLGSASRAGVIC